jgi:predicted ribonuclease YlaK
MADLYENLSENKFNLKTNEYLIVRNGDKQVVDLLRWSGFRHENISYKYQDFNSKHFGTVKPYNGDIYQKLAFDSLSRNKITMLGGPAGSGKSWISFSYLMSQLEKRKIDKIIVFCNTVAAKNAARLGFYPGDRDEKLLDSQIGNLLSSKLGDRTEVERLINEGKLVLLPFADLRGYDTTGMNAGIYISEAQNLDISLMKLALQRIGEDCICIIDGDSKAQVDDINFAGANNGMKRVSKVFRGSKLYGQINLKLIHRSAIANLAEKL